MMNYEQRYYTTCVRALSAFSVPYETLFRCEILRRSGAPTASIDNHVRAGRIRRFRVERPDGKGRYIYQRTAAGAQFLLRCDRARQNRDRQMSISWHYPTRRMMQLQRKKPQLMVVLQIVASWPGMPITEIADEAHLPVTTARRYIYQLQRSGYMLPGWPLAAHPSFEEYLRLTARSRK